MRSEQVIEVRGLDKSFAGQPVLRAIELAVPRGSLFGLIGRNGAGKTTLLRTLMGLLHAERGVALVFGQELRRAPIEQRARVAYVPQEVRMLERLSLERHAHLAQHFYPRFELETARQLAARLEVDWTRAFGALSGGARRKAAVVLALASGAQLLLLDEPAAGLDPLARRALYELLIERLAERAETTVLLSTHLLADLERLADRVAILEEGRLLRVDEVDSLTAGHARLQVIFPGEVPPDFEIPGAACTRRDGGVASGVADLARAGCALRELEARADLRVQRFPLRLEDIFVETIGRSSLLESVEASS